MTLDFFKRLAVTTAATLAALAVQARGWPGPPDTLAGAPDGSAEGGPACAAARAPVTGMLSAHHRSRHGDPVPNRVPAVTA